MDVRHDDGPPRKKICDAEADCFGHTSEEVQKWKEDGWITEKMWREKEEQWQSNQK